MKRNKNFMKTALVAAVAVLMLALAGCGSSSTKADGIGTHHVIISVENYGDIYVELDGDTAPITVQNFMDLASSGFYDGLTFHRVIDGFMIQGGDPNGDGTGGSANKITGEFSKNGIENNISHERGVISMARANDMNSASSQFFIMHADASYLDGAYAAFGHVTSGMDIVDAIVANTAQYGDSNGVISDTSKRAVIKTITVVD